MTQDNFTVPPQYILPIPEDKQEDIFSLIAQGEMDEEEACHQVSVSVTDFRYQKTTDQAFNDKLQIAYQKRADHWHKLIMKDVKTIHGKDEAAGAKLQFEKLKYLAEIDNPEKYGKKTSAEININHNVVHSLKKMSTQEAIDILTKDPFAMPIAAEFKVLEERPKKKRPPL
jgi:hypothetical protein